MSLSSRTAIASLVLAQLAVAQGFTYSLPNASTYPGGAVAAVTVDEAGNTYVALGVQSSAYTATPGAFQTQFAGGNCGFFITGPGPGGGTVPCVNAFVVKLNPAGSVVWATYLGSVNSVDDPTAIAVDTADNVYIAGTTGSINSAGTAFPTTSGSAFPTQTGSEGGFLAKISADGTQLLFGTYVPGLNGSDDVVMALDAQGNAYVAGNTRSGSIPATTGAFQTSTNSTSTGAILKFNSSGSALVYATYLGGTGASDNTQIQGIAVDANGSAYVVGELIEASSAKDFPVTPGAYRTTASSNSGFVSKLNPVGSALVYSTFLGGGGGDALTGAIKVDSQGRAAVLGLGSLATTPGAFEASVSLPPAWNPGGGGADQGDFLASLSPDGSTLIYGTYFSGAAALGLDAAGNAYITANVRSGFPVSAGATQPCYNSDALLAEFSPAGTLLGATYFGPQFSEVSYGINIGFPGVGVGVGPSGAVSVSYLTEGVGDALVSSVTINGSGQSGVCVSPVVQNAANYYEYGPTVSPGELVTLKGGGIGPSSGVSGSAEANGLLGTSLAGVQVFFDQYAAPLMYVQSGQINLQVPWEVAGQASTIVQVVYNQTKLNSFSLSVQAAAPGVFYAPYPSIAALVVNQNGSINSASNPASQGEVITFYGTGMGPTNPAGITGGYAPLNAGTLLALPVTVKVGGITAPVIYAGAAPGLLSSFFQINAQVPQGVPSSAQDPLDVSVTLPGGSSVGEELEIAVQ